MATTVRAIELMLPGSFGKETLSNDGMQNLALGISGATIIALTNVDHTLTTDNQGQAQHFVQILTGTLTANVNVIVPAESRVYVADNRTSGAFTVTFKTASGGGVAVDQGARTLIYCDGTTVYPVASGTGGGGGSGAPTDATYLVQSTHALLTGERAVTNTPTVIWDFATPGAAGAMIPPDAVSYAHIQNVTPTRLLGRFTAGSGDVQEITPGTGLTLDAGTGVLSATAVGQPLDATLTALAGLATGANQLPYSTGTDTFTQTPLTPFARTVLDDADQATMQATLGVVPGTTVQPLDATLTALAGVTTGADQLPFFTGTDTASTTVLTAFMRSLLDDPDAATARSTLGVTGGGGGSSDFLGLTDTPDSYSGQAGKAVVVNAGATALEFGTPAAGATTFLALTDSPDSYAGQAGKGVVVNGAATGLEFTTATTGSYDLGLTWAGTLPASQVLMRYPFPRGVDFPAGLTGSRGVSAVAATVLTTLDLRKNGTSVGSVQWAAAGTTATFIMASATSFAAGDILTVHAPASADATLADLGLSLAGTRAVVAGEMGATTWLGLTDTPDAYTGQGGNLVTVNSGATGLDYTPLTAAGRALLDDADAAAQRTTLGLGTMATQNASAVAITGGAISLGGHAPTGVLDVQGSVEASDLAPGRYIGARVWPVAPAGATQVDALRVEVPTGAAMGTVYHRGLIINDAPVTTSTVQGIHLLTSSGTNRWALYAQGTAPSYFGGTVQVVGNVGIGGSVIVGSGTPTAILGARHEILFARASISGLAIRGDADSGAGAHVYFFNAAGGPVGSITCTGSATSYNTSSDVRLKHAIAPLTAALDRVRALRPISHLWNADDSPGEGFLAHELMVPCPLAVSGLPDEVNPDGSVKPQQVDHSKLIPLLTAGLQAALAQIDVLTTRIATLEQALGA